MVANFTFKFLAVTGYSRNKSTRLVWRSHPREKTAQRFVLTNLNITLTGITWVNSSEHCEKQKQKKKNIWLQWKLCFLNLRHCQARREAEGFLLRQTRKLFQPCVFVTTFASTTNSNDPLSFPFRCRSLNWTFSTDCMNHAWFLLVVANDCFGQTFPRCVSSTSSAAGPSPLDPKTNAVDIYPSASGCLWWGSRNSQREEGSLWNVGKICIVLCTFMLATT